MTGTHSPLNLERHYKWTGKPVTPAVFMLLSLRRAHRVELRKHGQFNGANPVKGGIFVLTIEPRTEPRTESDGWWFWVGHNQSAVELVRQAFSTLVI